ncbi:MULTISPECIES: hypothetical protein [unclassified Sphingomonas]|nr:MULTISPECIES: hypothetical protein [unclassified Sphingomonas]
MHLLSGIALLALAALCAWMSTSPLFQSSWEDGFDSARADLIASRVAVATAVLSALLAGKLL